MEGSSSTPNEVQSTINSRNALVEQQEAMEKSGSEITNYFIISLTRVLHTHGNKESVELI